MRTLKVFDSKSSLELTIFVGENAQDNWDIIDKANKFDIWFHLDDKPSCHVILQLPDKQTQVTGQTLVHCASLCKQYSKHKNEKNIPVIYTEIQNLTKGKDVGSVTTKKTRKLIV